MICHKFTHNLIKEDRKLVFLVNHLNLVPRCGHLVKVILVIFRLRERGYLLTIYININIYIIVAVLTASVFDFDQMTMTK